MKLSEARKLAARKKKQINESTGPNVPPAKFTGDNIEGTITLSDEVKQDERIVTSSSKINEGTGPQVKIEEDTQTESMRDAIAKYTDATQALMDKVKELPTSYETGRFRDEFLPVISAFLDATNKESFTLWNLVEGGVMGEESLVKPDEQLDETYTDSKELIDELTEVINNAIESKGEIDLDSFITYKEVQGHSTRQLLQVVDKVVKTRIEDGKGNEGVIYSGKYEIPSIESLVRPDEVITEKKKQKVLSKEEQGSGRKIGKDGRLAVIQSSESGQDEVYMDTKYNKKISHAELKRILKKAPTMDNGSGMKVSEYGNDKKFYMKYEDLFHGYHLIKVNGKVSIRSNHDGSKKNNVNPTN
jgi:hypothetical protein